MATPAATTERKRERPGAAVSRNRDFLKLWAGETASLLGTQVTVLALPLVAVITLHASTGEVGVLNACRYAPFVLVILFAGVVVDRVRRRPTLMLANAGRALLIGLIPLAAAFDSLRVEYLYVVAFLVGVLTVFFDLAYQAYLPSLVERERLSEANTRLQASASAAELGGPGLGGLLVQVVTAPFALLVDAASFVVSIVSLATIETREPKPESERRPPMLKAIRQGFRFTFGNRYLRAIAGEAATFNLFEQTILTVFVV
jgi:MFS family permease